MTFFNQKNVLMHVHASNFSYDINHCENYLNIFHNNTYSCIIADSNFKKKINTQETPCFYITAREDNKTLLTLEEIWKFFKNNNLTKQSKVLIIGGGIVHDLGIMACTLYMRGIPCEYMPSTLLSMVDVCIGGKCAVNVGGIKNLIGTISPAKSVWIDTQHLDTLSDLHITSGLAEACKTAFIGGYNAFQTYIAHYLNYEQNSTDKKDNNTLLLPIITLSLSIKKQIVEQDEFDTSVRRYLNFGHTFAHALESATRGKIQHGIAVAIGILCAIEFHQTEQQTIDNEIHINQLVAHIQDQLLALPSVQSHILDAMHGISWSDFWDAFQSDKKTDHDSINLILPTCRYTDGSITKPLYSVMCKKYLLDQLFEDKIHKIFNDVICKKFSK